MQRIRNNVQKNRVFQPGDQNTDREEEEKDSVKYKNEEGRIDDWGSVRERERSMSLRRVRHSSKLRDLSQEIGGGGTAEGGKGKPRRLCLDCSAG